MGDLGDSGHQVSKGVVATCALRAWTMVEDCCRPTLPCITQPPPPKKQTHTWLHFQHQCLPQFVQLILLHPSFFIVAMPHTGHALLVAAMNLRFMACDWRSKSRMRSAAVVPRRRRPRMRTRYAGGGGGDWQEEQVQEHPQQQQQAQEVGSVASGGSRSGGRCMQIQL